MPKLDLESQLILRLLDVLSYSWERTSGMSGDRRTGIKLSELVLAADKLGVRLDYRRISLVNACIQTLVSDDIEYLNERAK